MANNTTLNELVTIFKGIAVRHDQINDFGFGPTSDIGQSREMIYPYLWVTISDTLLDNTNGGFSSINKTIEFIVADKIMDIENSNNELGEESHNGLEVSSDTEQIIWDILSEITNARFYSENDITITSSSTITPRMDRDDDKVNGHSCSIDVRMPWKLTYCGTPFSDAPLFTPIVSIITDAENPSSPISLEPGENYTCVPCPLPSGITYQRPLLTNQKISYRTGDDGWHLTNGTYDYTPPTFPTHCAQLDTTAVSPFTTLVNNNAFGNKNRFTDENGLQVFGNNVYIDHLSGLMYYDTWGVLGDKLWDDHIDAAIVFTHLGFDDWRLINIQEMINVHQYNTNEVVTNLINFAPTFTGNRAIGTSTTDPLNSGQLMRMLGNTPRIDIRIKASQVFSAIYVRNFYTSDETPLSIQDIVDEFGFLNAWSSENIFIDGTNTTAIDYLGEHDLSNPTSTEQPTFNSIGAVGVLSKPSLDFNGTTDYLKKSVVNWRGSDTTGVMVSVFKVKSTSSLEYLCTSDEGSVSDSVFPIISSNKLRIIVDGADITAATNDLMNTTDNVSAFGSNGSEFKMFTNGVLDTVVSGTNDGRWLDGAINRDNISIGAVVRSSILYGEMEWVFSGYLPYTDDNAIIELQNKLKVYYGIN